MALEFDRLSEVEALSEVSEGANVLGEVGGEIVRLPGSGLGGIKTVIIKSSYYDNALQGLMTADAPPETYSCTNMTFEEAYETMASGEPIVAVALRVSSGIPCCGYLHLLFCGTSIFEGIPVLALFEDLSDSDPALYWTADGIFGDN